MNVHHHWQRWTPSLPTLCTRFGANILDAVIMTAACGALSLLASFVVLALTRDPWFGRPNYALALVVSQTFGYIVALFYVFVPICCGKPSPGKCCCRIKIVDYNTGKPMNCCQVHIMPKEWQYRTNLSSPLHSSIAPLSHHPCPYFWCCPRQFFVRGWCMTIFSAVPFLSCCCCRKDGKRCTCFDENGRHCADTYADTIVVDEDSNDTIVENGRVYKTE